MISAQKILSDSYSFPIQSLDEIKINLLWMYRRAIQPEHFCELNLKILVPFFYKHVCEFIQPSGVEKS